MVIVVVRNVSLLWTILFLLLIDLLTLISVFNIVYFFCLLFLGIFLTCVQCYGGGCGGIGNFSVWEPEWDAKIGFPLDEPMCNEVGVWSRNYSSGLSLVNPNNTHEVEFELPSSSKAGHVYVWRDVYGNAVGGNVTLAPATGMVLLR